MFHHGVVINGWSYCSLWTGVWVVYICGGGLQNHLAYVSWSHATDPFGITKHMNVQCYKLMANSFPKWSDWFPFLLFLLSVFSYMYWLFIFSLVEYLFMFLPILKYTCLYFSYRYVGSLYIFWTLIFCQLYVLQMFSRIWLRFSLVFLMSRTS